MPAELEVAFPTSLYPVLPQGFLVGRPSSVCEAPTDIKLAKILLLYACDSVLFLQFSY